MAISRERLHIGLALIFMIAQVVVACAHPASELERGWKERDEESLIRLHTPTCWNDETDSGRGVYEQIVRKSLNFSLSDYRVKGSRALATFDVLRGERPVDRVYVYFQDGLVVAYDERAEHGELFLLGLVPGRIRLLELPGRPELDTLGRGFLNEPPPQHREHLNGAVFLRSHLLLETGRALLVYQAAQEQGEFGLIVSRRGLDWEPLEITFLPGVSSLIPENPGLAECAERMDELVEQLEAHSHFHDREYPPNLDELAVAIDCPVSGKTYRYAATIDFRCYGLVCEGDSHTISNYPAASPSSGLRLASTGSGFMACDEKLASLWSLLEEYKAENGRYPQDLVSLGEKPGIHLPRCSGQDKLQAPNETDYTLMHTPGGLHLFCTSVEHCGEGFAPLQPSYINGAPAKAMFLLRTE